MPMPPHRRNRSETGRGHPPDEPCPPARVRARRAAGGTHAGIARAAVGNQPTIDVHVQASASPMRCAAISTRIVCQRNKPMWPDSASAPRVGRKGARLRTRRCFGPAGSWSSRRWPAAGCQDHQCAVPRQMANRDRHKTLEKCVGCGQVTRTRRESVGRGLVARELLYALVVERRARRIGAAWSRLDEERRGTFWRVWKLIQDEVGVHALGVEAWREEGWEACMKVIMERPRRRKLQRLPDEVIDMYHGLPTSDQEELGEAA